MQSNKLINLTELTFTEIVDEFYPEFKNSLLLFYIKTVKELTGLRVYKDELDRLVTESTDGKKLDVVKPEEFLIMIITHLDMIADNLASVINGIDDKLSTITESGKYTYAKFKVDKKEYAPELIDWNKITVPNLNREEIADLGALISRWYDIFEIPQKLEWGIIFEDGELCYVYTPIIINDGISRNICHGRSLIEFIQDMITALISQPRVWKSHVNVDVLLNKLIYFWQKMSGVQDDDSKEKRFYL